MTRRPRHHDPARRRLLGGSLAVAGGAAIAAIPGFARPAFAQESSGLTEEWRVPTPNANRASEVVPDANFGFVDIDWQGAGTTLEIGIVDAAGKTRMSWAVPLASLQAAA